MVCKYQQGHEVKYSLDNDPKHVYIVRDSTEMPNNEPCLYHIELKGDSAVQMLSISESYMTDTVEIPPEASASS
jgi:hypothetical protein